MSLHPLQFKLIDTTTSNLPTTPTKASTSSLVSFYLTGKIQSTSKMCIHRRMIFTQCGHTRWGSEVCKSCEIKRSNTDKVAEKLRQALKDIRESVERMEKMQKVVETAKKAEVDTDVDEDLASLESWD
ncbi:hypothetical protein BOTCAL_0131g00020 [Botryotinia calthae]|uniref:Uncharacterized protein n=1 Tax=Botryotinia calthae TaxID=38488 RepID=A0A4Y8D4A7_9HELO|nr:hypothetical protein BOTCAL_0131g00020 [Botryotinia calthae]